MGPPKHTTSSGRPRPDAKRAHAAAPPRPTRPRRQRKSLRHSDDRAPAPAPARPCTRKLKRVVAFFKKSSLDSDYLPGSSDVSDPATRPPTPHAPEVRAPVPAPDRDKMREALERVKDGVRHMEFAMDLARSLHLHQYFHLNAVYEQSQHPSVERAIRDKFQDSLLELQERIIELNAFIDCFPALQQSLQTIVAEI
ncbi:hypothetical protein DENSPDRAFT_887063 [Dentipellis sp. KUC8613]|nr:hypothetical protein DENSPDRAFT_887063 [Dentipellis sp. KUC8613]